MALEPACRRGRSTGLARGAPTNRRPRATVSCAIAPPPGDFRALPPSSLQEQESLAEAQRLRLECPAEAGGALPGPAS